MIVMHQNSQSFTVVSIGVTWRLSWSFDQWTNHSMTTGYIEWVGCQKLRTRYRFHASHHHVPVLKTLVLIVFLFVFSTVIDLQN